MTAYGGVIPLPELVGMNAGAGGVISTADDLARWLSMQRGGVAADGTRLLSADLVRTVAAGPGPDRFLSPDMEAVTALVQSGAVARIAKEHAND